MSRYTIEKTNDCNLKRDYPELFYIYDNKDNEDIGLNVDFGFELATFNTEQEAKSYIEKELEKK